jgi:hypothetical protein
MPIVFLLLFATPSAHAMGSPSVLYLMGGQLICWLLLVFWILSTAKPWMVKTQSLVPIFMGFSGYLWVQTFPNYYMRSVLIESASFICLGLSFLGALAILKRK